MFDWIEKVVPQPPVKIHVSVVGEKNAPVEQNTAVDGPGLAKQLPEGDCCNPAEASLHGEDLGTVDLWLLRERAGQGLVFWLSQRLQKAIPQLPAAKTLEASIDVPEETEIQSFHEEEEELAIAVLESEEESDEEASSDGNTPDNSNGGKVFTWLMEGLGKIMPQPEKRREGKEMTPGRAAGGSAEVKGSGRVTSQSEPLLASPPSSTGATVCALSDKQSYLSLPLFPQRPPGNEAQSLFRCFLHGLEKVMPQPVTKTKQDGQQTKSTVQGGEEAIEMSDWPQFRPWERATPGCVGLKRKGTFTRGAECSVSEASSEEKLRKNRTLEGIPNVQSPPPGQRSPVQSWSDVWGIWCLSSFPRAGVLEDRQVLRFGTSGSC